MARSLLFPMSPLLIEWISLMLEFSQIGCIAKLTLSMQSDGMTGSLWFPMSPPLIDGISLTVAQIRGESIATAVVPHTESVTTLKEKAIGAPVNVEIDMMAKYVKRFVDVYAHQSGDVEGSSKRGLGDLLRDFADGK